MLKTMYKPCMVMVMPTHHWHHDEHSLSVEQIGRLFFFMSKQLKQNLENTVGVEEETTKGNQFTQTSKQNTTSGTLLNTTT